MISRWSSFDLSLMHLHLAILMSLVLLQCFNCNLSRLWYWMWLYESSLLQTLLFCLLCAFVWLYESSLSTMALTGSSDSFVPRQKKQLDYHRVSCSLTLRWKSLQSSDICCYLISWMLWRGHNRTATFLSMSSMWRVSLVMDQQTILRMMTACHLYFS